MDALSTLLEKLKKGAKSRGQLLGLFNVLVGRKITAKDGSVVSNGLTWRELAGLLKKLRWDTDQVAELGLVADDLPPRDRQRFWYTAILRAHVDSADAAKAGDKFAELLRKQGYEVGAPPT